MTSSEDFKQAIRTGNINEAFIVAMSNAPELSITTKIVTNQGKHETNRDESPTDNYLRTHINLIEGKIENEIGEKLTEDRYSEIQQFHIRQVAQGHQTIQQNLISLQKMFQLMSAFQQQQASEHLSWVDMSADVSRESLLSQPETNQLYGKTPSALEPGKTITAEGAPMRGGERMTKTQTVTSHKETDNIEPQLPALEEEDEVVNDLLSLADIDDDSAEEVSQEPKDDWGEWLEDEPEVKPKVFDLKSLNIKDGQNWQNWDNSSPKPE